MLYHLGTQEEDRCGSPSSWHVRTHSIRNLLIFAVGSCKMKAGESGYRVTWTSRGKFVLLHVIELWPSKSGYRDINDESSHEDSKASIPGSVMGEYRPLLFRKRTKPTKLWCSTTDLDLVRRSRGISDGHSDLF